MASILKVNTIQDATNSNTAMTINSSGNVNIPGSVVQVVTNEVTSQATFSSSSYTQALSINFTPKFSNSLVKHHFWGLSALNNVSYNKGQDCRWLRDSTVLSSQSWTNYFNRNTNPIADYYPNLNWHYVDTPNTTSQVTYKFEGRSYGGNGSDYLWVAFEDNGGTGNRGQWTIEEIAQ
jgi:hypothetical protein